ncbi:MAG: LytTR family DNA-binding domain-containing protein [Bacteroidota bacterium]
MTAVIIDDDQEVLVTLTYELDRLRRDIKIVGSARSVNDSVTLIEAKQPDIIFLDITLIGGTGFDLLQRIDYLRYMIIFISGDNFYGERALEFEALSYLNKPVGEEKLIRALEKADRHYRRGDRGEYQEAFRNFNNRERPRRIKVTNTDGDHFFEITDIICISSRGSKVLVIRALERKPVHFTGTLKGFDVYFKDYPCMLRVHNSHIVNLRKVNLCNGDSSQLTMADEAIIPVSRRQRKLLAASLESCC